MSIVIHERPTEGFINDFKDKIGKGKNILQRNSTAVGTVGMAVGTAGAALTGGILAPIAIGAAAYTIGSASQRTTTAKNFNKNLCIDAISQNGSRNGWDEATKEKCKAGYEQHVFNKAFELADEDVKKKMYDTYIEKCIKSNKPVQNYKAFCENFTEHGRYQSKTPAERFNDYRCAETIKNNTSVKSWKNKEKQNCEFLYKQDNIFNKAFEIGNIDDKLQLSNAYYAKCFRKEKNKYPEFCKTFVPRA